MTRWYSKVLSSTCRKELVVGGLIFITLTVLSVVQLTNGEPFAWRQIEPFSTPDFWHRIFWGALTFVTLGAVLYKIYFYKLLSMIFGSDRSGYRQIKRIIWLGLMYVNYQIFPVVIDIANSIASIVFNGLVFAVYISPYLFAGAVMGSLLGSLVGRKAVRELL